MSALLEKIERASSNIRLYGIAPPKQASPPDALLEQAVRQTTRLQALAPDGLVIYDIQDEPGRTGAARPFPFLPTIEPETWAYDSLAELELPKIVYRCVAADSRATFSSWLGSLQASGKPRLGVLVGAASSQSGAATFGLNEAYALARSAPQLVLGGVAIAERHTTKENEHTRMLAKQANGCRFFITQSVYDAASTKSLLSDYGLALQRTGGAAAPVILTFSPCGSVRTLEFMKWLGISFPRWLENELRHSSATLERSIDLCERVFCDIWDYAREKQLPIGINIESISVRKEEIDASVELYRRLSGHLPD